jgi:hypothetical protein
MRRWTTAALFGIGIGMGWSKEPRLPEALVRARTACLEGKTEDARDTDTLARELQDWRRLRLGIQGYCDVTLAIQHAGPGSRIPGAKYLDSDRDYLVFTVWDYHTGGQLYRDVVEWPLFVNPVRSAVRRLRFRLGQEAIEASTPPPRQGLRGQPEYRARAKPD